jgi:nitrogen-specific signal transduction histidine kinase
MGAILFDGALGGFAVTVDAERDDDSAADAGSLRALSRLSGWVAHEINNPLGGIVNAFALIRDAVPASHPHFKYVAAIEREIARIAALTQRLQHTYDCSSARNTPMPIARCVADALHALEPLRQARRVELEINITIPAQSDELAGDVVSRTMRHLAQHAIESAPPDSAVMVRVWRDADVLWLAVPAEEDDGRAPRAAVAGPPGLALQLVRNLVDTLGGTLSVTAGHDGRREIRVGMPTLALAAEAE